MPRLLTKIVNMTQITINGKSFKLEYNLATAINFQRLTGINAFEISKLEGDLQLLSALGYGMLLANNPIEEVPTLDEVLACICAYDKGQCHKQRDARILQTAKRRSKNG